MKGERPRIIKRRRRRSEGAHHGGAWKIALADFMTALMSLFLVLWVISIASPKELRGLAHYFSTPLSKAMVGGPETSGAASVIPGGGPDPTFNQGERSNVHLRAQTRIIHRRRGLRQLQQNIVMAIQADPKLQQLRDQLRFQSTPQGLRIQLLDSDRRPMFELGSDKPEPYMRRVLRKIAPLLNEIPNKIIINGYTDSRQYHNGPEGYSNWELSTARANASRRELFAGGLELDKLLGVTGFADRVPLPGTRPRDPNNRRIEVLVLTPKAAKALQAGSRLSRVVQPPPPLGK
ncbi:MAG TPA: flagellar motor protein MotB [Oleiagrimonas sp.]|nr:flagellar motor protein MotB [Oleiagrimonas sp.]